LVSREASGSPLAMQHNLAVAVQDTDVHGAGMEINATVKLMLLGVESPEVSSSGQSHQVCDRILSK
jgi:hypothetical protein